MRAVICRSRGGLLANGGEEKTASNDKTSYVYLTTSGAHCTIKVQGGPIRGLQGMGNLGKNIHGIQYIRGNILKRN